MSAFTGPNIVEDGLVLMLDVANGESFRGEPTTNNAGTGNIYTNWNNSGTATWVNNDTSVNRPYSEVQVNSMYKDTTGNSHIAVGNGTIDGTTWTFSVSVYIPSSAGTLAGSVPYFRSFPANVSRGALAYNGSTNWNSWPRDTWIRIERTWTNTAGDTSAYISCYLDTAGNKIYLSAPQLENKSYATPFVNGTRGATVATGGGWSDLSGNSNNGELVNGPTYSSSNLGSLVFDGVDDRTISPSNVVYGNNTTWSAFVNRYQSVNEYNMFMGRFLPYFAFRSNNQIHFSNRISDTQRNVYSATSDFQNNIWYGFTFTTEYDGTNTIMKIYINGVFNNSGTFSGSQSNDAYRFTVGDGRNTSTWYPFKGKVSNVTVYNRTLTPAEVLQNYNATKGRFGQ